jgi:hypothetical protein
MAMGKDAELPTRLDDLYALERAVEKEWWWLAGALYAVAEISAEVPHAPGGRFRELQAQKLTLDRKRVEIAARIATARQMQIADVWFEADAAAVSACYEGVSVRPKRAQLVLHYPISEASSPH